MSSYRESALKILLVADVLFENSDGVADREGCWGVSNRPEDQALIDVGGSEKPNIRRWRGGHQTRVVCNSSDGTPVKPPPQGFQ